MDVTQAPALDTTANRSGTAAPAPNESGSPAAASAAPAPSDMVDIRPLDQRAALQILIAEAGTDLTMPADAAAVQSPTHAAHLLIRMFVQNLPDDTAGPAEWPAGAAAVERKFESSLERAVATVANWRSVPPSVVNAAMDTRALAMSQLRDEPANPTWLRPEWLGLAPAIERYWRRRRPTHRRVSDPDLATPTEAAPGDEPGAAPDDARERGPNQADGP